MAATFTWDRCADAFYRHLLKKQQVKTGTVFASMGKAEYNQFQRCTCMDLEQMRKDKRKICVQNDWAIC